jgi:hypothetical protein
MGMGFLLTIGWLLITAYLLALLVLTGALIAVETVSGWLGRPWAKAAVLEFQEVDRS